MNKSFLSKYMPKNLNNWNKKLAQFQLGVLTGTFLFRKVHTDCFRS